MFVDVYLTSYSSIDYEVDTLQGALPYCKSKKRARRFFRKNSGSLIIHENGFWPLFAILSSFAGLLWLMLHILIDKENAVYTESVHRPGID